MKVLELYSGIGGMHFAFEESGIEGCISMAAEINPIANEVYKYNFPDTTLSGRNIQGLTANILNKMKINLILMSPPCQPFTRNGNFGDDEDPRSDSFIHILSMIKDLEDLNYILIENVKGFEKSKTRDFLKKTLEDANFIYQEYILSPSQFGVPNSRHRYYCLAKKNAVENDFTPNIIKTNLNINPVNPFQLRDILEDITVNDYELKEKQLSKYIKVLDICYKDSNRSCCFTKAYGRYLDGTGSVFCPISEQEANKILKEAKDTGASIENLQTLQLRYFTPKEISRLMCFPEKFNFPPSITTKQRYRLLGNSINIKVVSLLIRLLINNSIEPTER